jgi:F-type H+-transporting ATPase subunit a
MLISLIVISLVFIVGPRKHQLVPGRFQSVAELIYFFIRDMIIDIAGQEGLKYFPYIFTLFILILFGNVLGLLPYSFTYTSHIAITGFLAVTVFTAVTVLGFARNGLSFLKLFWIGSAPLVLRPILLIIEVISYFVRPISHSIRLAGNMMAGHAVIKVFAGFAGAMGIGAVAPIIAITAVYGLEMLVVVIQAYVFTILTCVYLNDALHPGH